MTDKDTSPIRLNSLDIMRGLAISMMIFFDSISFLSPFPKVFWNEVRLYEIILNPPTLTIVSGASLYFWFKTLSPGSGTKKVLKRSGFLVFGYMLYAAFLWGFSSMFVWEIITMLGVLTCLMWFLRGQKKEFYLILGLGVFAVSPFLHLYFNSVSFWDVPNFNFYSRSDASQIYPFFDPKTIGIGFLVAGWFPAFPWLGYGIIGYWLAYYLDEKSLRIPMIFAGCVIVAGIIMLALNSMFFDYHWLFRYQHFPSTLPTVLLNTGVNLFVFLAVYQVFDLRRRPLGHASRILHNIGQNALNIYLSTMFVLVAIIKYAAFVKADLLLWQGDIVSTLLYFYDIWYFKVPEFSQGFHEVWRGYVSFPQSLLFATLILTVLYILFHRPRYKAFEKLGQSDKARFINR